MKKLQNHTFKNIPYWEIKSLLKQNKDILWFKFFFKQEIIEILNVNWNKNLNLDDIKNIKNKVNFIWEYELILSSKFKFNKFWINLINKLIFWQNLEEFQDFIDNLSVEYLLEYWNENNLICFLDFCSNQSEFEYICNNKYLTEIIQYKDDNFVSEFLNLCWNFENLKNISLSESLFDMLKLFNFDKLIFFCKYFDIKNINDLEKISFNTKLSYFFSLVELSIIKNIFQIYWVNNLNDFINILENTEIYEFLREARVENFNLIIKYFNNKKDFDLISKNKNLLRILSYSNVKNLEKIMNLFLDIDDFINTCDNSFVLKALEISNQNFFEILIEYCNNSKDLVTLCENIYLNSVLEYWKSEIFLYFLKLYKIKSLDELLKILINQDVRFIIQFLNEENFKKIIEFYNINNAFDFENIYKNSKFIEILKSAKTANLTNFLNFCWNTKNFELFLNDEKIIDILIKSDEINFNNFLNFCWNINEFKSIYQVDIFVYYLKNSNNWNFKTFLNFCWTVSNLKIYLTQNLWFLLDSYKTKNLELILNIITNKKDIQILYDNEILRFFLNKINSEILDELLKFFWNIYEFSKLFNKKYQLFLLKNSNINNIKKVFQVCENLDQKKILKDFLLKKIFISKQNTNILFNNNLDLNFKNFWNIFLYYLENKRKSIVEVFQILWNISLFELNIDLNKFKTIDDFRWENWEIDFVKLKNNFKKILELNNDPKIHKSLNQFDNFTKAKNISWLNSILMENFMKYFHNLIHKKLKIKIISEIKKVLINEKIDFDKIDETKFDNPIFIEACKMAINPKYNKFQITLLLYNYLIWKFDNLQDLNQYNTNKNIDWLNNYLTKNQQKIWLSANKKEITLENNNKNNEILDQNLLSRINNHFEIAILKLHEINKLWFDFKTIYSNPSQLVNYFYSELKKHPEFIKNENESLFKDFILQISSIKEISFSLKKINSKNSSNIKTSSTVLIQKELDPLEILMMWNYVDWSCLSFYSLVWNYYSSISNAIDVNKWVYYIKDEYWNILWRCLLTIWNDKKLSRYNMYYNWNVNIPIDNFFDDYTVELSKKLWLELNWSEEEIENIECDYWYLDWIKFIQKND